MRFAQTGWLKMNNAQPQVSEPSVSATTASAKSNAGTTVKSKVVEHFRRGGSLTAGDAWQLYGTSRLGAIVFRLKREGIAIRTEMIEVVCADGRTAHVAEYRLREQPNGGIGGGN